MFLFPLTFTPGRINRSDASTDGQDSVPSMKTQRAQRNLFFYLQYVSIQSSRTVNTTPYTGTTSASTATAHGRNFLRTLYRTKIPQAEADQRQTIIISEHPAQAPAPVPNTAPRTRGRANAQEQVQSGARPRRSQKATQDARYDNS